MSDTREALLVRTFVTLADSLVADYDVIDLLQTLVEESTDLFDATASGIALGADDQHLEVVASTSEESRLIELMQVRVGEGPCMSSIKRLSSLVDATSRGSCIYQ